MEKISKKMRKMKKNKKKWKYVRILTDIEH